MVETVKHLQSKHEVNWNAQSIHIAVLKVYLGAKTNSIRGIPYEKPIIL